MAVSCPLNLEVIRIFKHLLYFLLLASEASQKNMILKRELSVEIIELSA